MLDTYKIRTEDMADEMKLLLNRYPRDTWDAHPGFREKTQHWLAAHQMFRRVAGRVREDIETYLDGDFGADDLAGRLSYFGGNLVGNLHGHHGWEDHVYFPELATAEPRFQAGLDVLESDHADLDIVLEDFTTQANRVIKLAHLDETQMKEQAGVLHHTSETISAFLERHLNDEEDLAVPIILHHRLRG